MHFQRVHRFESHTPDGIMCANKVFDNFSSSRHFDIAVNCIEPIPPEIQASKIECSFVTDIFTFHEWKMTTMRAGKSSCRIL